MPSLGRLESLLSRSEQERASRFRFERDRRSYLLAHALLRTALSHEAEASSSKPLSPQLATVSAPPIAPADWQFVAEGDRKPEILGPETGLTFNISHTVGLVACVVAHGLAVGVDVEHHEFRGDPAEVARTSFSEPERRALAALSHGAFRRMFFALWTLKEATVKALGVGLSMPLDDFAFDLAALDGPRVSFFGTITEAPDRWQFVLREPGPDHTMALAIRKEPGAPLRVRVREGSALLKPFL